MGVETRPAQMTEAHLAHHWMLDGVAAADLAQGVTDQGHEYIEALTEGVQSDREGIQARDGHRQEIAAILRGESQKKLAVIGPCSLDAETDYEELFDYIEDVQAEHPDTLIALRANGSKPRTSGGWGGLFRSTQPSDQELVIGVYQQAFHRRIATLTEVTDQDEFGTLAPYLSAGWLGARDMQSTALHSLFMATRLPVLVKNGTDGKVKTVENALTAIGPGSRTIEDGSGVNLGRIAYTYSSNSVGLPAMVEVGQGNPNTGIIARGYELPRGLDPAEKKQAAFQHLGELCTLASEMGRTVLLDGGHGVPPMMDIDKKESDRFARVVGEFREAIAEGMIPHADRIRGYLAEISTNEGRTDRNWLVADARQPDGLDVIIRQPLGAVS